MRKYKIVKGDNNKIQFITDEGKLICEGITTLQNKCFTIELINIGKSFDKVAIKR